MPSTVTPAFLLHVADNVRAYRTRAGLSQKALADLSGVSQRMIGGIEAGATSVSTATLDRIGVALEVTLSDLVRDPAAERLTHIDRLGWEGTHGGTGVLRTSIPARREVETWAWLLQPGERYEAAADPEGWHVMLVVVEGKLTLAFESESLEITADCYIFESSRSHAFANFGKRPVRFFRSTIC